MTIRIGAYANASQALVVWFPEQRIDGCLGFALYRRSGSGNKRAVNTRVRFSGSTAPLGGAAPSTQWPIQAYHWVDYDVAEDIAGGSRVKYRVVPVLRRGEALVEDRALASEWSDPVEISAAAGAPFRAYFNRGIVADQEVWHAVDRRQRPGQTPREALQEAVHTIGDPVRESLSRCLRASLLTLLAEARQQEHTVYAALFLLNDPELLVALRALGERLYLVLANGREREAPVAERIGAESDDGDPEPEGRSQARADENRAARDALERTRPRPHLVNRMLNQEYLGHNKFAVVGDAAGKPLRVLTGSANWTVTGLCTQANNALVADDPDIADIFKKQWDRLSLAGSEMTAELLEANATPKTVTLPANAASGGGDRPAQQVTVWFAPHSFTAPPTAGEATNALPPDLAHAASLIDGAEQAILFLMYTPAELEGVGSLYDVITARAAKAPGLYVRGVIDRWIGEDPNVRDFRAGARADAAAVVIPRAVDYAADGWLVELERYSTAVVHSKVVVLDPFGRHPVVMTGAHNLGPHASRFNDENLVIVENNPDLARAYAVNIVSLYQHYRLRYLAHLRRTYPQMATQIDARLSLAGDDTWQDAFYDEASPARRDVLFWLKSH